MNDPITNPSRLNRRRKKRWKIADLLKSDLTDCYRVANLFPLSQKTKVGPSTPNNIGHQKATINVVFLCPSFSAALCRIYSVMAGCVGQAKAWPVPMPVLRTPYSPPPNYLNNRRRFIHFT